MHTIVHTLPTNTFKRALVAGERLLGLWVNFAHVPIVEVRV